MTDRDQPLRTSSAHRMGEDYHPYLDGVRALAVILVLLFHLGYTWIPGGFIGVDVFFVLSGYLVTGVLLREVTKRGKVRLLRFYSRRVRRLLPAATVVLLAVFALALWLLDAVDKNAVGQDVHAAALWSANWHFISAKADYFAPGDVPSPVVHFWSLAVEEQFYLVWPVLIGGVWMACTRLLRRGTGGAFNGLTIGIALIAAVSIALSLILVPSTNAYYSTFTRAYELCVGALLAIAAMRFGARLPNRPAVRWSGVVAVFAAVAALIALAMTIPDATHYPGTAALMVTGASLLLIAALELAPAGLGHRTLGSPAPAAVGRISYSLYLWHWPVIVFAPLIAAKLAIHAPRDRLVQAVAILALAVASFMVVESPIRFRLSRFAKPALVVGVGLAVSFSVAFLVPNYLKPQAAFGKSAMDAVRDRAEPGRCPYYVYQWGPLKDNVPCLYRKGGRHTIAFVGDSHAQQWQPALLEIAKRYDFTVIRATRGGCPANTVTSYRFDDQGRAWTDDACDRWRAKVYRMVVSRYDPDFIFVATRSQEKGLRDGTRNVNRLAPDHVKVWGRGWDETLRILTTGHGRVVVNRLLPTLPWRVPACLASKNTPAQAHRCDVRLRADRRLARYNRVIDGLPARHRRVSVVNTTPIVCPHRLCPAIMNGMIVHRDDNHVTATFARAMERRLEGLLVQAGAITLAMTQRRG
jgi:peptidoglycan/LPS O-acetylase OafA/YrhL